MEGAKIKHNRDSCIDVILGVQGVRVPPLSRVGGGTVPPLFSATRGRLLS